MYTCQTATLSEITCHGSNDKWWDRFKLSVIEQNEFDKEITCDILIIVPKQMSTDKT